MNIIEFSKHFIYKKLANTNRYSIYTLSSDANIYSIIVLFKSAKDAQAVIDNPNFRTILDKIYK